MPRLSTSLLRKAYAQSKHLPYLLRSTRDLESARNELRWLRQYVAKVQKLIQLNPQKYTKQAPDLARLCKERGIGRPLQYLLGSQPFGDLEILCRKGVLIPRPETETYTTRLANLLLSYGPETREDQALTVLDLCAGTGCIGLGLLSSLHQAFPGMQVRAVDVNHTARDVARKTITLNQKLDRLPQPEFLQYEYILADILQTSNLEKVIGPHQADIIVSNPPYISIPAFSKGTSRSARSFEPRNALVPSPQAAHFQGEASGDIFYDHILRIATYQKAKIVVMEVDDLNQAKRVLGIVKEAEIHYGVTWSAKQIWCDGIDVFDKESPSASVIQDEVQIIGSGNGRAIVLAQDRGIKVITKS